MPFPAHLRVSSSVITGPNRPRFPPKFIEQVGFDVKKFGGCDVVATKTRRVRTPH